MTDNASATLRWGSVAVASIALIAVAFSPALAVTVALLLAIAYAAHLSPAPTLIALLAVAPIFPMLKITSVAGTLTLAKDVVIIILFLKYVLYPLTTKQLPYRRNPLALPMLAIFSWAVIHIFTASVVSLGVFRARDIILYMLAFFAVLYTPLTRRQLLLLGRLFLAATAITVALAAYQWFFAQDSAVLRFDPVREIWIPRLSSIMAHPSIFGEYLIFASSLLTAVILFSKKTTYRLAAGASLVIVAFTIFLTYSRAVWIAFATLSVLATATYIWNRHRGRLWQARRLIFASSISLAILALLLIVTTPVGVYVRSAIDPTYGSNEERLEFMARLIAPLSNTQALIGSGLGDVIVQNFRSVTLTGFDIASGADDVVQSAKNTTLVDNQHLKTFVELGLLGLLLYAAFYLIAFVSAAKQLKSNDTFVQAVAFIALAAIVTTALQGFFIDVWEIFPTNLYTWVALALAVKTFCWTEEKSHATTTK